MKAIYVQQLVLYKNVDQFFASSQRLHLPLGFDLREKEFVDIFANTVTSIGFALL